MKVTPILIFIAAWLAQTVSANDLFDRNFVINSTFEEFNLVVHTEGSIFETDLYGSTPLHKATMWPISDDKLEALLAAGSDVNARDNWGNTPLHNAAIKTNYQHVRLLIEAGAQINAQNDYGATPLFNAARSQTNRNTLYLLQAGANPNLNNSVGYSALMRSVKYGSLKTVIALIESGANLNARTKYGLTPLIQAVYSDSIENVELLMSAGVEQGNSDDFVAMIEFAQTRPDKKVYNYLIKHYELD